MTARARLAAGALLALGATVGLAQAAPAEPTGRVVFARGGSLWMTDGRGKAAPVVIATLPVEASDVRYLRTDAAGDTILADLAGRWFWLRTPAAGTTTTLTELPCASGAARLSPGGEYVLCSSADSHALIVRLRDGAQFVRNDAPATGASLTERDGQRELVFLSNGAIVAGALKTGAETRVVAAEAPLRGLVASPNGARGVGVYKAPPVGQPKVADPRDQLSAFALDGVAARRRLIRDGVVLDWSADSAWLLIQDGGKACIARAVGGEYKCWKGFTAVSLAPDGAWALVLGPRDAATETDAASPPVGNGGEGADGGEGVLDDAAVALPTGPLSLYRAKLGGAYTEKPATLEKLVDGAAVWLPPAR